jgi:hypothetical protein
VIDEPGQEVVAPVMVTVGGGTIRTLLVAKPGQPTPSVTLTVRPTEPVPPAVYVTVGVVAPAVIVPLVMLQL